MGKRYTDYNVLLESELDDNNIYGITEDTNSHMMKNSEWAAVAYLSQSEYGKYGNSNYEGINKSVYLNNSRTNYGWARYTGRSIGKETSGYQKERRTGVP